MEKYKKKIVVFTSKDAIMKTYPNTAKQKKPMSKNKEYDSVREQTVLLEHMNQSIQAIMENSRRIKTLEVGQQKLEQGQERIEQKLDAVTTDHEQRITSQIYPHLSASTEFC